MEKVYQKLGMAVRSPLIFIDLSSTSSQIHIYSVVKAQLMHDVLHSHRARKDSPASPVDQGRRQQARAPLQV